MLDVASMGAALGSLKAILDLLKNANDAQLAMKISGEVAQVQGRLLDVQQQALALQTENEQLKAHIQAFNDEKEFLSSLEFDPAGIYKRRGARGDEFYCSACLDHDGKRVRLSAGAYAPNHCHIHGYREAAE